MHRSQITTALAGVAGFRFEHIPQRGGCRARPFLSMAGEQLGYVRGYKFL